MLMAERRYDDKEVAQILNIATERQLGSSLNREGMTLQELLRVAEEIGIDPEGVEGAAAELDMPAKSGRRHPSDSVLVNRRVNGGLPEQVWEELINELRRSTGKPGQASLNGTAREWSCGSDSNSLMLSASTRDGKTWLRLLGDTSGSTRSTTTAGFAIGVLLTTVPFVVAAKSTLAINSFVVMALAVLIAGLTALVVQGLVHANRKKFEQETESVADRLSQIVGSVSPLNLPSVTPLTLGNPVEDDEPQASAVNLGP